MLQVFHYSNKQLPYALGSTLASSNGFILAIVLPAFVDRIPDDSDCLRLKLTTLAPL